LPPLVDLTDVLEKHPKSTRFVERYWRRRDDAPAASRYKRGALQPRQFVHFEGSTGARVDSPSLTYALIVRLRRLVSGVGTEPIRLKATEGV
jgi:hypothetical protein